MSQEGAVGGCLKLASPHPPQSVLHMSGLVSQRLLLKIKLVVSVYDLGYFSEDSGFLASLSSLIL